MNRRQFLLASAATLIFPQPDNLWNTLPHLTFREALLTKHWEPVLLASLGDDFPEEIVDISRAYVRALRG